MKKARHKLWQLKKLEITQNELTNEFDNVKLRTEFMKEKKFNKLIDYIQFQDFLDIHLNKTKSVEKFKCRELLDKLGQDLAPECTFEYPMFFLELMDYLAGAQIYYPQEMFDVYSQCPVVELNLDESMDDEEEVEQGNEFSILMPYKGMNSERLYSWFKETQISIQTNRK